MAVYQTLFNPATKQVRAVDISIAGGAGEVGRLYQEGWKTYVPTPEQTAQIVSQPTAPAIQPTVTVSAPARPSALVAHTVAGKVDLVKVAKSGDRFAIAAAEKIFGQDTMKDAQHLAKTPVTQAAYDKLGPGTRDDVRVVTPVSLREYNVMSDKDKVEHFPRPKKVSAAAFEKLGPAARRFAEQPSPSTLAMVKDIGLSMVPFVGTQRTWSSSGTAGKALGIVADALWVIPFLGGVSAGVRATSTAGRVTRAGTAAKATKAMVIAEIKAPVTMLRKPLRTLKTVLEPVETALRPSKLPVGGLELRYSTQRIPVLSKADEAMRYRDYVTDNLIQGRGGKFAFGEVFEPRAIKGIRPVAVHTTPDIRPFLQGATVKAGREGGLFMAPTVHTRFAAASAFGDLPTGGARGIVLINDPAILAKLTGSGKIYRGRTEIEKVLAGGVKLPKPVQTLMTRDAGGDRLAILVIGNKLSRKQIAKFKLVGSLDTLRTIYTPSVSIRKKSQQASGLLDKLADSQKGLKAAQADLRLARRRMAGQRAVSAARARVARLTKQVHALRQQIERATTGRVEYLALNTRSRPVLTQTRPYAPTKPAPARKGAKAPTVPPRRPPPPSGDRPTAVPPRRPPPPSGDRPTAVPPRRPPPPGGETPPPPRPRITDSRGGFAVQKVVNVAEDPGRVSFNSGIVKVTISPPYTSDDITYKRLKKAQTGRGSQEDTLSVKGGDPPSLLVLSRGINRVAIRSGRRMTHSRQAAAGPNVILKGGKRTKQRRGSLI